MAFASNQIGVDQEVEGPLLRAMPTSVMAVNFSPAVQAAGFPPLFPMVLVGGSWQRWVGGDTQLDRILAASTTATDGTFTLTVNGKTTDPIAHDADADAIKVEVVATGVGLDSDMTFNDSGGGLAANNGSMTMFWTGGNLAEQPIYFSADFSSLVGNVHVSSQIIAGTVNRIDAFVWPDNVMVINSGDTTGNMMLAGRIHVDDIVVDVGRNLGSIKASMKINGRRSAYELEGLVGFG